jgi:hypothetical protein
MVFLIFVSSLQPVTVPSRLIPLLVSCDALVHGRTRCLSTGGLGVALCERWSVQRFLRCDPPISQMFSLYAPYQRTPSSLCRRTGWMCGLSQGFIFARRDMYIVGSRSGTKDSGELDDKALCYCTLRLGLGNLSISLTYLRHWFAV